MVYTVGILGPNGMVGRAIVKYLLPRYEAGQVKLVLLHRPGGPPRYLPDAAVVESREIDLDNGDTESLVKAISGVNIFVSAIAPQALALEVKLAEALGQTKGLLYFIPSLFGRCWRPEEANQQNKQNLKQWLFAGCNRAAELGVKTTIVECGYFDYSMFQEGLLGANASKNTLCLSAKQVQHPLAITSTDYLGAAIATLVMQSPEEVAGKTFSAVQLRPTGQDMIDVFTKLHAGKPTEVTDFTKEDLDALLNDATGFGVAIAGYRENWELNQWDYSPAIDVVGKDPETLEEVVKRFV